MKNSEHHRQMQLADDIQAHLNGLREKYARKLRKPLGKMVRKLSRKYARLLTKHHRAAYRDVANEAAKLLIASINSKFGARQAGAAQPAGESSKLGLA